MAIQMCPYCGSTNFKRINGKYECFNCPTDGSCYFDEPAYAEDDES